MDDKYAAAREALREFEAALQGKDPEPQKVTVDVADDGSAVTGDWYDLVEVHPRDVVTLCDAALAVERDPVVKDLRKGSARQAADPNRTRPVMIQARHAKHLADRARAAIPPGPEAPASEA